MSWLLIFLWEVLWQFCYQIQSQVLWLLHICSFEIQGQILWLIHCRDVKVNVWKLYSVIFDYKVKFLNKKLLYKFLAICSYIHGLYIHKYNTMFQNVKRVFYQNKAHTKISSGLQFCRSISYTFIFPAYIFAIIFGKPKDSLISARTDWFISVITGLVELLWLRWITWKTETTFCLGMPFLV